MQVNFNLSALTIPGCVLQLPVSKLENSKIQWARKARQQSEFLLLGRAIDDLGKLSAEVFYKFIFVKHFLGSIDETTSYFF